GVTGVAQFEPWELVKIALVIFFAAYLDEYREMLSTPPRRFGPIPVPPIPYLLPIVGMWLVAMLVMVFEKDLGATLLFFGIFLAMLYLATGEPFYVLIGLILLLGGGFVAYHAFGHVAARVDVWLAPFDSDLRDHPPLPRVGGELAGDELHAGRSLATGERPPRAGPPMMRSSHAFAAGGHPVRSLVPCVRGLAPTYGRAFAHGTPPGRHHRTPLMGRPRR